MRLTVVVNTYNQPAALDAVLGRLSRAPQPADEIVVADDGSTEPTRDVAARWAREAPMPLKHVWQEKKGFRRSRILNLAIAAASGDYLVFVDGDCLPTANFARDHRALAEEGCFVQCRRCFIAESSAEAAAAGSVSLRSLVVRGQVGGIFKAIRLPWPIVRRDQNLHGVLGCNLGIWRADLMAVNGYDEAFEGWGKEDSELAARLYHIGIRRKFVYGRAILFHLNHPPASREHVHDAICRLEQTLTARKTRCERGLDQHLPAPAAKIAPTP